MRNNQFLGWIVVLVWGGLWIGPLLGAEPAQTNPLRVMFIMQGGIKGQNIDPDAKAVAADRVEAKVNSELKRILRIKNFDQALLEKLKQDAEKWAVLTGGSADEVREALGKFELDAFIRVTFNAAAVCKIGEQHFGAATLVAELVDLRTAEKAAIIESPPMGALAQSGGGADGAIVEHPAKPALMPYDAAVAALDYAAEQLVKRLETAPAITRLLAGQPMSEEAPAGGDSGKRVAFVLLGTLSGEDLSEIDKGVAARRLEATLTRKLAQVMKIRNFDKDTLEKVKQNAEAWAILTGGSAEEVQGVLQQHGLDAFIRVTFNASSDFKLSGGMAGASMYSGTAQMTVTFLDLTTAEKTMFTTPTMGMQEHPARRALDPFSAGMQAFDYATDRLLEILTRELQGSAKESSPPIATLTPETDVPSKETETVSVPAEESKKKEPEIVAIPPAPSTAEAPPVVDSRPSTPAPPPPPSLPVRTVEAPAPTYPTVAVLWVKPDFDYWTVPRGRTPAANAQAKQKMIQFVNEVKRTGSIGVKVADYLAQGVQASGNFMLLEDSPQARSEMASVRDKLLEYRMAGWVAGPVPDPISAGANVGADYVLTARITKLWESASSVSVFVASKGSMTGHAEVEVTLTHTRTGASQTARGEGRFTESGFGVVFDYQPGNIPFDRMMVGVAVKQALQDAARKLGFTPGQKVARPSPPPPPPPSPAVSAGGKIPVGVMPLTASIVASDSASGEEALVNDTNFRLNLWRRFESSVRNSPVYEIIPLPDTAEGDEIIRQTILHAAGLVDAETFRKVKSFKLPERFLYGAVNIEVRVKETFRTSTKTYHADAMLRLVDSSNFQYRQILGQGIAGSMDAAIQAAIDDALTKRY